jgi:hypothetical protein
VWRKKCQSDLHPLWDGNHRLLVLTRLDKILSSDVLSSEQEKGKLHPDVRSALETVLGKEGTTHSTVQALRRKCLPEKVGPVWWVKERLLNSDLVLLRQHLQDLNHAVQASVKDTFVDCLRSVREVVKLEGTSVTRGQCAKKLKLFDSAIALAFKYRFISEDTFRLLKEDLQKRGSTLCHCAQSALNLSALAGLGEKVDINAIYENHIKMLCSASRRYTKAELEVIVPKFLNGEIKSYDAAGVNNGQRKGKGKKKQESTDEEKETKKGKEKENAKVAEPAVPTPAFTEGKDFKLLKKEDADVLSRNWTKHASEAANSLFNYKVAEALSTVSPEDFDGRYKVCFTDPPYSVLKQSHDEHWDQEACNTFATNITTVLGSAGVLWLKVADHQCPEFVRAFSQINGWKFWGYHYWIFDGKSYKPEYRVTSKDNKSPTRGSYPIMSFCGLKATLDFSKSLRPNKYSPHVFCDKFPANKLEKYNNDKGQSKCFTEQMPVAVVAHFINM